MVESYNMKPWGHYLLQQTCLRPPANQDINNVRCANLGLAGVHGLNYAAAPTVIGVTAANS